MARPLKRLHRFMPAMSPSRLTSLRLSALAVLALTGCPGQSAQPLYSDGGPAGDGGDRDGGGSCQVADRCPVEFRYPADSHSSVELRGDFAPDGWENGVALVKDGQFFRVTVQLEHDQSVQYKFLVDGTEWVNDPVNRERIGDGFGGENSLWLANCDTCAASAYDWRDGILYFVFLDRFIDGDTSNNAPLVDVDAPANYAGGDLAGVLEAIESGYFDDMGVNALWLTAPMDNADQAGLGDDGRSYSAYHGYWPSDLDEVESRVGTMEELEAVVDAAHARGMKVFLDYVMNHVSSESPVYAEHPDWFWPLDKDGGGQCVCGGGCDWGGDEGRRCWFRSYLPDFDFTNPAARSFSVANAIEWIERTGIDGYRLDAVKHIETQWIVDLRSRLRAEIEPERGTSFYLVGETFDGDRGLIGSYVDPDTMLDGQFDFPLRAQLVRNVLRREGNMSELAGFLEENDRAYHPRAVMGTFIGNHDLPRPIHIAEDSPQFGEWDSGSGRGWDNLPTLPDYERPFERLAVAYAFLMTTPGMPLIYYGDEIGMAGGGDPDNRRVMQWDGLSTHQTWLRQRLRELTELRGQHSALRRGSRQTLWAEGDQFVFRMLGDDDIVYIALNRGDGEQVMMGLPDGSYLDLLSGTGITMPGASVPARGYRVLIRQ